MPCFFFILISDDEFGNPLVSGFQDDLDPDDLTISQNSQNDNSIVISNNKSNSSNGRNSGNNNDSKINSLNNNNLNEISAKINSLTLTSSVSTVEPLERPESVVLDEANIENHMNNQVNLLCRENQLF